MSAQDGLFRALPPHLSALRSLRWRMRRRVVIMQGRGRIDLPKGSAIGPACMFKPPGFATFGSHLSIGARFHLEVNVRAGEGVVISSNVAMIGNDHEIDGLGRGIYWDQRLPDSIITIGDDVLIGFGSVILGSMEIATGTVIGAGSLVTQSTVRGGVYVGRPAKLVRVRPKYA